MKTKLSVTVAAVLLAGCASTPPNDLPSKVTGKPLYANMLKVEDGWKLVRLSPSSRLDGITVDLSTGMPKGLNTGTQKCTMLGWSAYHDEDSSCEKGVFRSVGITPFTVPSYLMFGALSAGAGLIFGIASVESYFDWDEYTHSFSDALAKSKLDEKDLVEISYSFDELIRMNNEADLICADIRSIQTRYESQYYRRYKDDIEGAVSVSDRSGFGSSYGYIDGQSKLTIKPKVADIEAYLGNCSQSNEVFSISADLQGVNELQKMVSDERQRLASVKMDRSKYEAKLKAGGSFLVRCEGANGAVSDSYHYDSSCDERVLFGPQGLRGKPKLNFVMKSRNFSDVLPSSYVNSDANLAIELDGGVIKVANRTERYISLSQVSLYYNGTILTRGTNAVPLGDLPPESYKTYYLSDFDLDRLPNDFVALTAQQAKMEKVNFAISAKYQITGSGVQHTLYKSRSYDLIKLL